MQFVGDTRILRVDLRAGRPCHVFKLNRHLIAHYGKAIGSGCELVRSRIDWPRRTLRIEAAEALRAAISMNPALPNNINNSPSLADFSEKNWRMEEINVSLIISFNSASVLSPRRCLAVRLVTQLPNRSM